VADISDADRIFARGAPITLRGQQHRVILDFEALELIEREFASLDVFVDKLRSEGWKGERLKTIRMGMTAGLLHTKPREQTFEDFTVVVRKLLEPSALVDYLEALTLAIAEAFPAPTNSASPKEPGSSSDSPGPESTFSQPSISDARTKSGNE
jgi:hypothetical protein